MCDLEFNFFNIEVNVFIDKFVYGFLLNFYFDIKVLEVVRIFFIGWRDE